jgi:TonB-dependent starch-binding outer membrane protein SusC
MKKILLYRPLVILAFFLSCTKKNSPPASNQIVQENPTVTDGYTTVSAHNNTGASSSVEHTKTILSLDDHIRGLAGVNVTGSGSRAIITVRGINSFQSGSTEPLFVINGSPMASYSSAFTAVNPIDIKRVTVLTDASSTAIYGVRGSNGVIIITLKSTK